MSRFATTGWTNFETSPPSAAIRAGGSSLSDYVGADGHRGDFQSRFWVYDREGKPCRRCGATVKRLVQGQRSTFFCPRCQK